MLPPGLIHCDVMEVMFVSKNVASVDQEHEKRTGDMQCFKTLIKKCKLVSHYSSTVVSSRVLHTVNTVPTDRQI